MIANNHRILDISALALVVGLSAGCASTSELQEVRAMAESAQLDSDAAGTNAGEAKTAARSAQQTAEAAERKADQALQAANDANSCCEQNSEKLDRMFKKSMSK